MFPQEEETQCHDSRILKFFVGNVSVHIVCKLESTICRITLAKTGKLKCEPQTSLLMIEVRLR